MLACVLAVACGAAAGVTYYPAAGAGSITLNPPGTLVIVAADGTTTKGSFTLSNGTYTLTAPNTVTGGTNTATGTINSSGCLVLSPGGTALCPTKPSGSIAGGAPLGGSGLAGRYGAGGQSVLYLNSDGTCGIAGQTTSSGCTWSNSGSTVRVSLYPTAVISVLSSGCLDASAIVGMTICKF